jgi:hypothetical protein
MLAIMFMMLMTIDELFVAPHRRAAQQQYEDPTTLPAVCNFHLRLLSGEAFKRHASSESICEKSDLCDRSTDLTFISVTVGE